VTVVAGPWHAWSLTLGGGVFWSRGVQPGIVAVDAARRRAEARVERERAFVAFRSCARGGGRGGGCGGRGERELSELGLAAESGKVWVALDLDEAVPAGDGLLEPCEGLGLLPEDHGGGGGGLE